jgi:hypothetical protein
MEAALAENGEKSPAKRGSLRWIARQLLIRADEDTAAAIAVSDRLDGKPPQAIVGDSEAAPQKQIQEIRYVIVRPGQAKR